MLKPHLIASYAVSLLAFAVSAHGQSLLLQYNFDNPTSPFADTGAGTSAPGTLIATGSASGVVSGNTPSGTGSAFSTGDGNNNYLTTGTIADPEGAAGDVDKLDSLPAFTLTLWVNLQSVAANDRFMSDGGAPGGAIDGFDFLIAGPTSGSISASNFRLTLSVDKTAVNSTVTTDALNQWVFFAVTYDGSQTTNNVVFYQGTTSSGVTQLGGSVTLAQGPVGFNSLPFQVAGTAQTTGDRSPTGLFDDVRVYSGVGDAAFLEGVRLANVPEPSVFVALLSGTAFLGLIRRRRLS